MQRLRGPIVAPSRPLYHGHHPLLYCPAMFYAPVQLTAIFVLAAVALAFGARFALGYFGVI